MAVLFLSSITLTLFILMSRENSQRIFTTEVIDSVYAKESQINYFLENLINKVEIDPNSVTLEQDFRAQLENDILSYKNEIGKYVFPELGQIELQIQDAIIILDIDSNLISITFDLILRDTLIYERDEIYSIEHTYQKEFRRRISQDL